LLDRKQVVPDHGRMSTSSGPYDLTQWLSPATVAAFDQAAESRRFAAGTAIYTQADPGDELFRIVAGSVRISVMGADGRELLHQVFGPGGCIGTSSMIDGDPRPQTAEAFEDVELQVISRQSFNRLRVDYPDFDGALLNLLSRHMRLLIDYFASASLDSVALRMAQRLVDAAEAFGVAVEDGIALPARLSQSELALMVGTARQTANRAIGQLRKQCLLRIDNGTIVVSDLPSLRVLAQKGWRLRGF
jgi:CRP/FNR family transcriptional regulator, cyclic AMP receptor protein